MLNFSQFRLFIFRSFLKKSIDFTRKRAKFSARHNTSAIILPILSPLVKCLYAFLLLLLCEFYRFLFLLENENLRAFLAFFRFITSL